MNLRRLPPGLALVLATVALAVTAVPARAGVTVSTPTDEVTSNSACSLREAITAVGNQASFDGCTWSSSNPNTITLPAGHYTETRTGCGAGDFEDGNDCGDFDIQHATTIAGAGASTTTVDGGAIDRVFDVFGSVTVAIDGVTITNGKAPSEGHSPNGGGILNAATLSLDNDVVTHNLAGNAFGGGGGSGGGIYTTGSLGVTNSTIASNSAGSGGSSGTGGSGGGIEIFNPGAGSIVASTIANNHAGDASGSENGGVGGGILTASSQGLTLLDSTVAANTAGSALGTGSAGFAGGIELITFAPGTDSLINDTIVGNRDGAGSDDFHGAIDPSDSSATHIQNTIIASNTRGNCTTAPFIDDGHNLTFGDATCTGIPTGDPQLGPLADNGGPTQTMKIATTGAAYDKIPLGSCVLTPDQRGVQRPQGNNLCDIGSFEVRPYVLTAAKAGTGSGSVTSSPAGIDCGATCSAQFDEGTQVTLTATPAADSTFEGWSGGGCSGTGPCTFAIGADTSVTAEFKQKPTTTPPDNTPPDTTISKAKIDSAAGTATFTFGTAGKAKAESGFQCALAKKHKKLKFKDCTSPKKYKHLKPGKYTFEVRAVNDAGTDMTPATQKFKIK